MFYFLLLRSVTNNKEKASLAISLQTTLHAEISQKATTENTVENQLIISTTLIKLYFL